MSFLQAVRRNAAFRSREVAMRDGSEEHTWSVFQDRVARLASALTQCGVREGEHIAILACNGRRYLEVQIATWWAGGVIVPMNTRWSGAENLYVANDANVRFLFVDRFFYADAEKLAAEKKELVLFALDDASPAGMPRVDDLIDAHSPNSAVKENPNGIAGIYYTGGTTGQPKGVLLTHNALWVNAISVAHALQMNDDDRVLHAAPIFHLGGGGVVLAALVAGASHVFIPKFVAADVIDAVERHEITKMLLVPSMIQMMFEDARYAPERLATLDTFCFGASPISNTLLNRLKADLPNIALLHVYGQTEMGPTVSYLPARWQYAGSPKGASVGTPFIAVEAKVADARGNEVPRGTTGEIWARGPGQMIGYLNKPEETAAAITPDGWIRTGDIAYQDEDGFLYICDRAKDMVITGGENVFSGEVENVLLTHPAIREAAVIGIPDPDYGEGVHAVLVLREGYRIDFDDLRRHCRKMIAAYKCPRSFELRDSMPLSAAGKILKRELRAPYWKTSDGVIA